MTESEREVQATSLIVALVCVMGSVEQCHGCMGQSADWPQYEKLLNRAADFAGMSVEDRWW